MVDSDIARYNDKIQLNAAMDEKTRAALYVCIRRQIACNFQLANSNRPRSVCHYCHVEGGLNEDVAFILVSNDAIVTNISDLLDMETQPETVSCEHGDRKAETVTGVHDITEQQVRADSCKKTDVSGAEVEAEEPKDSIDEVTELVDSSEIDKIPSSSGDEECSKVKLPVKGKDMEAMKGDIDVVHGREEGNIVSGVVSAASGPNGAISDTTVNGRAEISMEGPDIDNILYIWDDKTLLVDTVVSETVEDKDNGRNAEFKSLLKWLKPKIGSETRLVRFPVAEDLAILSPVEKPEQSVTWRLAESLQGRKHVVGLKCGRVDGGGCNDSGVLQTCGKMSNVSSVIFIGPFDPTVVRHCEIVRRRVAHVIDDLTPDDGDVYCVTDIGSEVGLSHLTDIVGTSVKSLSCVRAYTAVNPRCVPASCVLLRLNKCSVV
jgi:hypothetical protein